MQPTRLRLVEVVRLERRCLADLYAQLGEPAAEEVICRAMEELAMRIAMLDRSQAAGDWAALAKGARSLVAIAEQVGMTLLAHVAADVTHCAERCDVPATAATLARLVRTAERSLTAVWDSHDLSG